MMMIRPIVSGAARGATRRSIAAAAAPGFARTLATEAPKPSAGSPPPSSSSSNTPLILALAGVGGLGAWYAMGGFGDKPSVPGTGSVTGVLDKNAFKEFTLKEVIPYNHDSSTFIFEIPQDQNSGMTVASAVVVKGVGEQAPKDKEGKDVVRPYTPVTSPDTKGHIDFLIKKYPNGAMTEYIHAMKPGDKLEIKGPFDKHQYKANEFEEVAMIAGGSGITPMWQLLQAIKGNPQDKTKATLIYTNKTEADILLREKFDELAKSDDRFTIVYGLDKKPKNFTQADAFEGYVTPEILSKYLPAPAKADKVKIFVCGPPPQVEAISGGKGPKGSQGDLKGLLADQGYQPSQVYKM
ncbi:ferredoxin reductase-like protein [Acaromyces ingoldii]|uniref:NADH-cytochrome b5 reductase n=1 Tax=Acaromyces ingoldii TaxID=215250 RepID=A0A316YTY1_9BASI|nr:ferredoxin reductase-like protein [Acaromyces ingoldii]PWN93030.1 ferredoxin reductase-like protein [Acaromyces ingoldii]